MIEPLELILRLIFYLFIPLFNNSPPFLLSTFQLCFQLQFIPHFNTLFRPIFAPFSLYFRPTFTRFCPCFYSACTSLCHPLIIFVKMWIRIGRLRWSRSLQKLLSFSSRGGKERQDLHEDWVQLLDRWSLRRLPLRLRRRRRLRRLVRRTVLQQDHQLLLGQLPVSAWPTQFLSKENRDGWPILKRIQNPLRGKEGIWVGRVPDRYIPSTELP